MRLKLSIEEKEEVRRLQRDAVGTPDYVRLTCILMFDNGRSSKAIEDETSDIPYINMSGFVLLGVW